MCFGKRPTSNFATTSATPGMLLHHYPMRLSKFLLDDVGGINTVSTIKTPSPNSLTYHTFGSLGASWENQTACEMVIQDLSRFALHSLLA